MTIVNRQEESLTGLRLKSPLEKFKPRSYQVTFTLDNCVQSLKILFIFQFKTKDRASPKSNREEHNHLSANWLGQNFYSGHANKALRRTS